MTDQTSRRVRFAYVTLLLGLTVFAAAESALGAGSRRAEGLSTCGTEARPCALEPLAVVAAPAEDEGLTACGSAENPCVLAPLAVQAERPGIARLANTGQVERVPVAGKS